MPSPGPISELWIVFLISPWEREEGSRTLDEATELLLLVGVGFQVPTEAIRAVMRQYFDKFGALSRIVRPSGPPNPTLARKASTARSRCDSRPKNRPPAAI